MDYMRERERGILERGNAVDELRRYDFMLKAKHGDEVLKTEIVNA